MNNNSLIIPTVRQSNDLIEAVYKIPSIGEARILYSLMTQLKTTDEDFKIYKISVSDFASVFGLAQTTGSIYKNIDIAAKALASRVVTIRNGKSWIHTHWLSSVEYKDGDGFIELCFDAKMKPHLLQLKGYFTQYHIRNIAYFKSLYSIRLYQLLKSQEFKIGNNGFKRSFDYEELRDKFGIENTQYHFFKDFRVNVIEVAKREINQNSDILIVSVDYAKTGRKVTHIVFHCETRQQPVEIEQTEIDEKEKKIPDDLKQMISLGIAEKTAMQWRKKYGVSQIVRNIGYTLAMKKAGKIRETEAGFLASAIANDSGGGWELEQQAREKARKERELSESQKSEKSDIALNEERARRQILIDEFHALPELEQDGIRRVYETQANATALTTWNLSLIHISEPTRPY